MRRFCIVFCWFHSFLCSFSDYFKLLKNRFSICNPPHRGQYIFLLTQFSVSSRAICEFEWYFATIELSNFRFIATISRNNYVTKKNFCTFSVHIRMILYSITRIITISFSKNIIHFLLPHIKVTEFFTGGQYEHTVWIISECTIFAAWLRISRKCRQK